MSTKEMSGRCPMAKIENISGKIIAYIRGKLIRKYGNDKPLRTFHAKTIGVVEGELKIRDDLPDSLKVGLFKQDKTYKVWIRFTNGSPTVSPDENKAARGMAIKVLDVKSSGYLDEDPEGNTQDIILFTSRIYAPGIPGPQLSGVKAALTKGLEQIFHAICVAVVTFKPAINFLKSVIISPNILEEMYYSGTPYSFGDRAIKWHAKPIKTITSVMPKNPGENFLSERLSKDLSSQVKEEIAFALFVQFHESEETEPIDDSGIEWKTPFHRVATITIPKQNIDTPERHKKDLDLTYSPGHSMIEHAPLGGVNMIRKKVYKQLAKERLAHS